METKTPQNELVLTPHDWGRMKAVITSADEYCSLQLSDEAEFRFMPLEDSSYSAVLSVNGRHVFHFMWEEVTGLVNITHRIVNPEYRGRGMGSEVLYAIEQRLQRLSNRDHCRYSLMIETTQLSVVHLGLKRGMQVSRGAQVFTAIKNGSSAYSIDEKTHVSDENGYRIPFRISKAFVPLQETIIRLTDHSRQQLLQVLKAKAA